MQNFIVLGLVPGTHIQLTFTFWLIVSSIVIGLPTLFILVRWALMTLAKFTQLVTQAEFILP